MTGSSSIDDIIALLRVGAIIPLPDGRKIFVQGELQPRPEVVKKLETNAY